MKSAGSQRDARQQSKTCESARARFACGCRRVNPSRCAASVESATSSSFAVRRSLGSATGGDVSWAYGIGVNLDVWVFQGTACHSPAVYLGLQAKVRTPLLDVWGGRVDVEAGDLGDLRARRVDFRRSVTMAWNCRSTSSCEASVR